KGTSEVCLSDGLRMEIKDLVDLASKNASKIDKLDDGYVFYADGLNISVLSLNLETLKIEPKPVYAFVKRKAPEYLLEIKTKSGREIVITHYHPFFGIKDSGLVNLKAEDVKKGTKIALPRILNTHKAQNNLNLFDICKRFTMQDLIYAPYSEGLSEYLREVRQEYKSFAQTGDSCAIGSSVLKSALSGQAMNIAHLVHLLEKRGVKEIPDFISSIKSRSCGGILLPRRLSPQLARFLGYLISEGRLSRSNQAWFTNDDEAIINDYISCAKEVFGLEPKVFQYKKTTRDALIFSHALNQFLEKAFGLKIGSVSKEKIVPAQIFSADREIIVSFLSSFFEGDGYVSVNRPGSGNYFEYATASKALANGVSSLLLQLGVVSIIRQKQKAAINTTQKKKRMYYSVFVYGVENTRRLAGLLKFVGKKAKKLEEIKSLHCKTNPNLDLIPEVNRTFKELVKLSRIKVKWIKKIAPRLISYYEDRCLPSRQGLLEALSVVAEHGKLTGLARCIYDYLKELANSDIYWDEVISVRKVYSEKWVYDLSILGNHNFIAQGIIVHNSNIFDSIRWVLGEQSAKSLRGSDMQDVIFNGTDSREPLGMAEVTLTFDNQAKFFHVEHPELAITRRLFRSGESEYLLNKTPVRLKDILDILLGTGIGAESYSIIAQGKIDLVLSSRPDDRRLVFDEASGITKYKAQKRETTRKLEETGQNLLRINDIIAEVRRQIGSLERQANKARRYKEAFEELKSKEITASIFSRKELLNEKNKIIEQLKGLESRESELLNIIRQQESKIANRQSELKALEDSIMLLKNQVLNLENMVVRNTEHINFNKERLIELEAAKKYLEAQLDQAKTKVISDEDKLNNAKEEYGGIKEAMEEKSLLLSGKQAQIDGLAASIKNSLETISELKKEILDLVLKTANARNEASDFNSQQQIYSARKKRLEVEKAKVFEEKAITEESLSNIIKEVGSLSEMVDGLSLKISEIKSELDREGISLSGINSKILSLENQKLAIQSHKEFLEKLKNKYEDIGESMNAVIYLDRLPTENVSGLVVKIKDRMSLSDEDKAYLDPANFKLSGEAKPIELDTQKIDEKINKLELEISALKENRALKESHIEELNKASFGFHQELRTQEIALANKETSHLTILEKFNRAKEEEDVIVMELQDVSKEISVLEQNLVVSQGKLSQLGVRHKQAEDSILIEEEGISKNSKLREEVLVVITQTKTELEGLTKRVFSEEATLKILEDTYRQDLDNLLNIEKQIKESDTKKGALVLETKECELKTNGLKDNSSNESNLLQAQEAEYRIVSESGSDLLSKIELDRQEMDRIKMRLYELQMQDKDIDYKYSGIRSRMSQAYKIELEGVEDAAGDIDMDALLQEIEKLKEKLDTYGSVNLVAIEEYDELKKRYDFLIQQQTDLLNAKESLHQAILKINRTTKQMFLETFEKVKEEFRNYFRLLFNGGDARVFLTDEQDPLESGIEIICRPPGKKLQNVLLLSGGEKSMSAIALIFAIFKVKPSPFCVLDEIDAALDEANVDRFSRVLQEFAKSSQFIVITHNKKTIVNANVMYGITMENSGVSKIVSVKFAGGKMQNNTPLAPCAQELKAMPETTV
ncbi:MAG: LAGLIDADG family homing endonuclease, partial [Candidatus Omnitrophota bacterium]